MNAAAHPVVADSDEKLVMVQMSADEALIVGTMLAMMVEGGMITDHTSRSFAARVAKKLRAAGRVA